MTSGSLSSSRDPDVSKFSPRIVLGLWMLSGALLLSGLGAPPVARTQEARVLETARQMVGAGWHGWLVPQINGKARLQKPPLCYWMSAMADEMSGVSEFSGRVPAVIFGWLTIGLVFIFVSRAFDQRTALLSCAAMLGSNLFFRHSRLAETDAPAMLFVTLAVYAIWRAQIVGVDHQDAISRWLHLCAAAIAMAVLAKGGPAVFPVLFLIGIAIIERRWDLVRRFITSGALLTLIAIATPWFLYIFLTQGDAVFRSEVDVAMSGRDHFAWPTIYIPWLLLAAVPWTVMLPLALFDAGRNWRRDPRLRMLLIWCGSIILPLCVIGNKQPHYLLPAIPPLMMLIGRLIAVTTRRDHPLFRWMPLAFAATVVTSAGAILEIVVVASEQHGHLMRADWVAIIAVILGMLAAIVVWVRRGVEAGFATIALATCLLLPMVVGWWMPRAFRITTSSAAREIRANFRAGPYVFFGPEESLTLCFNLRSSIPLVQSADELLRIISPKTVVITQTKRGSPPPPPLPAGFVQRQQVAGDGQVFDLYELEH